MLVLVIFASGFVMFDDEWVCILFNKMGVGCFTGFKHISFHITPFLGAYVE
jgi:hypothetical protein